MTGFEWGMGLGGWLWMLLGSVLLVVVVWIVLSGLGRGELTSTDDAARILKARLARGEITQAEYEQARRLLGI